MEQSGITEDEVVQCLQHGELAFSNVINGERRYGKKIALKEKTIMVVCTLRNNEERVITAYDIQRKKEW